MALPVSKVTGVSPQAYFELSAQSEHRLEYRQGEILDMGRTTDIYSELMLNTASALKVATRGKKCKVYAETVSIEIEPDGTYYLPDVMLTCDPRDHQDRQMKRHPGLVVEVVSPGSEKRDKGEKFIAYLKFDTLRYYLLVYQDKMRIEVFEKMPDGGKGWIFNFYEQMEDVIELAQLGIALAVADVYEDVMLTSETGDAVGE